MAHGVVKYVFCLLFLLKSDKITDYTATDLVLPMTVNSHSHKGSESSS